MIINFINLFKIKLFCQMEGYKYSKLLTKIIKQYYTYTII